MKATFIVNLLLSSIALAVCSTGCNAGNGPEEKRSPNFIVIFADDMGYGDVGVYGHPTIKTPNLDDMAHEGQKWTSFYVAASVCTPSRAGLLTGRLPVRNGMCSSRRRVLFPDSRGGIPDSELTIASLLKSAGYATACIGKWHLGHLPQYLPTQHGFDYYFGIPYSNDMDQQFPDGVGHLEGLKNPKTEYFHPPLLRNTDIIERPTEQSTITLRYTEETIRFIEENQGDPFFVYLAHSMPHVPLFRSEKFENRSLSGIYGDVIEELDWSVGKILTALKDLKLDEHTLVLFTSDNGPWLIYNEHGGSAGLLRGGKGGTYEGGMREPAIFWGPGIVKPQVVMELGTTLDLLPTFCGLANIELPGDRIYDGYDLSPVLTGSGESPRDEVFYYRGTEIYALRKDAFKAHFITQGEYGGPAKTVHDPPLLYNLEVDPSEKVNIAEQHPEVLLEMQKILEKHRSTMKAVENQLEK
jgi:arylsulfatase A-like enzyme